MTTKDIITLVIAATGAAVALLTFLRALIEYRQQGRQRRTEQFFAFGRRIEEQPSFQKIRDLLDTEVAQTVRAEAAQKLKAEAAQKLEAEAAQEPDASQALAAIPASEKFEFLGAYEELALLVRSGLVRAEVAHYMHGYYAIRCKHSGGFWKGHAAPTLASYYWSLFADFVNEMERLEGKRAADRRKQLRF
jgi:hypothetical protein